MLERLVHCRLHDPAFGLCTLHRRHEAGIGSAARVRLVIYAPLPDRIASGRSLPASGLGVLRGSSTGVPRSRRAEAMAHYALEVWQRLPVKGAGIYLGRANTIPNDHAKKDARLGHGLRGVQASGGENGTNMSVRLLLVDDHPMMRGGMRQALEQQPRFSIVGEASSGELAVKLALELTPDLVVMDIHLLEMNGLEATRRILSALPATKILILSSDPAGALVDEALRAGACGYIFKRGSAEELARAIDEVMAGKLCLSPELSAAIVEDYQRNLAGAPGPRKPKLSEREKQLLRLITAGRRNKEIAAEMELSPNSIETYRARLMKKVLCRSTAELVRYAIREGIAVA